MRPINNIWQRRLKLHSEDIQFEETVGLKFSFIILLESTTRTHVYPGVNWAIPLHWFKWMKWELWEQSVWSTECKLSQRVDKKYQRYQRLSAVLKVETIRWNSHDDKQYLKRTCTNFHQDQTLGGNWQPYKDTHVSQSQTERESHHEITFKDCLLCVSFSC